MHANCDHDHGHYHSHHGHSDHDHSHHGHHHAPKDFGRAFFIGILLNSGFIAAEIFYGLHTNSLALLADAGHNASDVLGLFLAWGAAAVAKRMPSERYTYGLQSSTIMAALTNAVLLFLACGGIGWEAAQRLMHPESTGGLTVMIVAGIGILVNGFTAWLFMAGHKDDLNIKGAFLHMLADAVISLGVVIAGAVMLQTGWLWLDPLVSITIAVIIVISTWGLMRDSLNLALHGTPKTIKISEVKAYLCGLEGVREVHDLHVWAMSTTTTALSAHLLMPAGHPGDRFIKNTSQALEQRFKIQHVTIQIEMGDTNEACEFAPDEVV